MATSASLMPVLVEEHLATIYRYAYRLTGNAIDAEDLTQQTFLAAQRHCSQLRDPLRGRAWLCSILRRLFIALLRSRTAALLTTSDLDRLASPELAADLFDDYEFERADLQAAIDALPIEFRLVVLMFYFEDCSYVTIAERLDIPVGTVMSRLARAKQRLKNSLLRRCAVVDNGPQVALTAAGSF